MRKSKDLLEQESLLSLKGTSKNGIFMTYATPDPAFSYHGKFPCSSYRCTYVCAGNDTSRAWNRQVGDERVCDRIRRLWPDMMDYRSSATSQN
jgi:hypothetical protein